MTDSWPPTCISLDRSSVILTKRLYVLLVIDYSAPQTMTDHRGTGGVGIVANSKRLALALGGILVGLCIRALAQSPPGAGAPISSSPAGAELTEIIVTATKREERLQDVPIAVTVVGGTQLTQQNINEVVDLTRSVPSLNAAGPFGALSIRGVGSVSFSRSAEGSVGVVVDGVSLANTSLNPPELFDVARVEVLEGPQGMLFGRNSSAGLINVVTNAPDSCRVQGAGHADVATQNNSFGRAIGNIPSADNAALRITGA